MTRQPWHYNAIEGKPYECIALSLESVRRRQEHNDIAKKFAAAERLMRRDRKAVSESDESPPPGRRSTAPDPGEL